MQQWWKRARAGSWCRLIAAITIAPVPLAGARWKAYASLGRTLACSKRTPAIRVFWRSAIGAAGRAHVSVPSEIPILGTGNLVKFVQGLISIAVQNNIIVVFDNDAVLPGATCASACAQIVFLAGIHRIVAEGGKLGMHTCAIGRNRSPLCNQTIAQNALEHGTATAQSWPSWSYTGPSEMVWFNSKDADCFGFTRWPWGRSGNKKRAKSPHVFARPSTVRSPAPTHPLPLRVDGSSRRDLTTVRMIALEIEPRLCGFESWQEPTKPLFTKRKSIASKKANHFSV